MTITDFPAKEFVPGQVLTQLFRAEADALSAVTVLLATWGRRPEGEVRLRLSRLPNDFKPRPRSWTSWLGVKRRGHLGVLGDAEDELLIERTLDGDGIVDNAGVTLHLPRPDIRAGDLLALSIEGVGSRPGAAATAWISSGVERLPGHVALYRGSKVQREFGLKARVAYAPLIADTPVPSSLLWSPVTQCNLNCIHCISRDTRKTAKRLPENIREQIRTWAASGHLTHVASDYSGDILWADARFGGELDFLIGLDVAFAIDTNGTYLTPEASARLSSAKLNQLNISLDGATDATFRRVRKGAPPLADVIENVRATVEAKKRAGATHFISASFALMRSNLDEFPDFLRLAHEVGVEVVYGNHLMAFTPEMEAESLWHERERYNAKRLECLALAAEIGLEMYMPEPFGIAWTGGRRPCSMPWQGVAVLGNGDVNACCVPGLKMGNLHENTIEEIWNGEKYRELRWSVNSDNPPPSCRTCPFVRDFNDVDTYMIHTGKARTEEPLAA